MRKMLIIAAALCSQLFAQQTEEIRGERGTYQLNFATTYVSYVNLDIEMMITLPDGYKYTASVVGARDYVSASPIQNTMYVTKVTEANFETNLSMHVVTPEGVEEKLVFKLIASKTAPKVYAIHFERPNTSELNRTIEAIKGRYNDQLAKALSEQEVTLEKAIHDDAICDGAAWFVKKKRTRLKVSDRGLNAIFMGMYNSRGNTYLYFKSNVAKDECDKISIHSAGVGKQLMEADFLCVKEDENGGFVYTYYIPELKPVYKKSGRAKYQKMQIKYKFWENLITQKFKIS